jgi:hypothetical protein
MIVVVVLLIAVNVPVIERFTITDGKSGRIVFLDKVEDFREFYTSFIHSVNKTPVDEYYRISDGTFILEKAIFYSYGAGMPELGEYGSSMPRIIDDMVLIDNINKEFEKITIYAGIQANHTLNTQNGKIAFLQLVEPQTPVIFEVRKVSFSKILRFFWMNVEIQ